MYVCKQCSVARWSKVAVFVLLFKGALSMFIKGALNMFIKGALNMFINGALNMLRVCST